MKCQKLCANVLLFNYERSDVFDRNSILRLTTVVVNRSDLMSEDIATKEHIFHFEFDDIENDFDTDHQAFDEKDLLITNVVVINLDDHDLERTLEIWKIQDHSELEDLLHASERLPDSRDEIIHVWLKEVYRDARDFELRTLNLSLLTIIMKRQSMKWRSLTQKYIVDIVTMSHSFVIDLLHVMCSVERVRIDIVFMLMNHLMKKYKSVISHVNFLLEIELAETSTTLNHYFNDNLKKW